MHFQLFLMAGTQGTNQNLIRVYFKLVPVSSLDRPFFAYFGQFSKRLFDFEYIYLCQIRTKCKTNTSKFKLAHWQSKHVSFLKMSFVKSILRLIKQEYFSLGQPV